ncbi:hypothetical protein TELCIR_06538 [Teladorsagia circumcincta]|uniref:Uncharacterized protein n=1 Tax=Teladorsagia circumcincta TaxID=45464 RepID=A0A2G9UN26_TELCI|nr:hypothetical protein TELCIR_06538 [Teladorsagia circumcincta]
MRDRGRISDQFSAGKQKDTRILETVTQKMELLSRIQRYTQWWTGDSLASDGSQTASKANPDAPARVKRGGVDDGEGARGFDGETKQSDGADSNQVTEKRIGRDSEGVDEESTTTEPEETTQPDDGASRIGGKGTDAADSDQVTQKGIDPDDNDANEQDSTAPGGETTHPDDEGTATDGDSDSDGTDSDQVTHDGGSSDNDEDATTGPVEGTTPPDPDGTLEGEETEPFEEDASL